MQTGLSDKVVLITGAAQGIGRATAYAFAKEQCRLALIDIDHQGLAEIQEDLQAKGIQVSIAKADLLDPSQIMNSIDMVLANYGGTLDVLVNNVGAGKVRTFDELTDADWDFTMNLNFMSYVRAIRHALPLLRNSKGVIINNASDLARQPEPVPIDYSASKAAVLALTKGLARAEAPDIRVNAVAPGPVWTPFWTKEGGFADTMGKFHKMDPKAAVEHELELRRLPMNRLGQPEEVANVIVFMASDLASFVTSSVWGVDGGSIKSLV